MCLTILLSILYFVLAASFCVGDYPQCSSSFFTRDGPYDTSRRTILSTLGSKVSSRDGYYNGSVGNGRGRIYALGQCIPGAEPKRCSDCIQVVSNNLLISCLNETKSYEYGVQNDTLCLVRYSDSSFFDDLQQLDPVVMLCNREVNGNVTEFDSIWTDFMEDMIVSASSRNYAAKVSRPMGFQRIYSLMMCIPGLSSTNCGVCLRRSVSMYEPRCKGMQGFNFRRPQCYFKWETFPFHGANFEDQKVLTPLNPQVPQPTTSPPPQDGKSISTGIIVVIIASTVIFVAQLALGVVILRRRQSYRRLHLESNDDITSPQSLQFDFKMIEAATKNFSANNKIGQGGFGEVYMGIIPNGTQVAVKRLSKNSGQGIQEFKNEVALVAKLQHKNLVSLLGFCFEGNEQILVYEFVPNKSLDYFLFGPTEQQNLDWRSRYNIIGGIARGILYLHQDSRFTIIHRDLKASNILLDDDMNPKIADFGMARIFGMEQSRANTNKIAGTFGYMAPEYAMRGQFSMKSDVYSFGVLVLEILSGKINSSFNETDGSAGNLVTHAWRLWRKGLALKLLDSTFAENYRSNEVTRCIHIALLCVQEDPQDRPLMSTVILLLTSTTITIEIPRAPGFFLQSSRDQDSNPQGSNSRDSGTKGSSSRDLEAESSNSVGDPVSYSINDTTITELDPR